MSDALNALNELFVNYGADIQPGEDLDWKTYEVPEAHRTSIMNFIKEQVDFVNQGREQEKTNITPFCNPIIHIFHKLEFTIKYISAEFEIWTKNKKFREEFAQIWPKVIKGWYFSNNFFIGYGSDFREIDNQRLIKEGKIPHLDGYDTKFRLYTRNVHGSFHSVLSGQPGLKFEKDQILRMTKFDSEGMHNWLYWWFLWAEWLAGMQRFKDSIKALSKNVVLTPKNKDELENIRKQFDNNECFIHRNTHQNDGEDQQPQTGKTKFDELAFLPRENPLAILEAVQRYFELNAVHLGYSGKFQEQKKERINAGENYPYQKVAANIRTYLISSLNMCFDRMRKNLEIAYPNEEIIPKDLKIVPTNQAFAQGLPEPQLGGNFNQFGGGFNNGFNKFGNKWNSFNKFDYENNRRGND